MTYQFNTYNNSNNYYFSFINNLLLRHYLPFIRMDTLFPAVIDNNFEGIPVVKYAAYPLCITSSIRSLIHIFYVDGGAQSIATIPLNYFSESANSVIIMMFALWGVSQLLLALACSIILFRYQKCIPFIFFITALECVLRLMVFKMKPIVVTNYAPGGAAGSFIMLAYCTVFLILSVTFKKSNSKLKTRY